MAGAETLDTSGSVAAAGELISPVAMKAGVIVKASQNVLIGLAAFALSIWWDVRARNQGREGNANHPGAARGSGVSARVIWERFPKFVLGFVGASLLFSFAVDPATAKTVTPMLNGLRNLWFALAFVSIGLETHFGDLLKLGGGRPALAFLVAQAFNVVWTLGLAWLLFGGSIFPVLGPPRTSHPPDDGGTSCHPASPSSKAPLRDPLLPPGTRCVVAVSGGRDSMLLLALLDALRPFHRWDLVVAHLHHQLRAPDADADRDLVLRTASHRGLRGSRAPRTSGRPGPAVNPWRPPPAACATGSSPPPPANSAPPTSPPAITPVTRPNSSSCACSAAPAAGASAA